ncbi:complement factor H isoform X2 [Ictalurus punctatus]|nr:complement factor H isoform X2 [Ictalurus punctatus]
MGYNMQVAVKIFFFAFWLSSFILAENQDTTCEYPRGEHLLNNPPNFKRIYKLGENTWYRCEYGYQRTAASITCTENSWEPEPQCIEITCQKPEIAHGEVLGIQKNTYNKNVKIALKCNQGYEPGIFFVTCKQNGEWDNMRQCTLGINLRCRYPEREINDAIRNDTNLKAYYEEGGGVQYKCKEGFYFQHGSKAVCSAGKWKYPQCIKLGINLRCRYPEREINDAIRNDTNLKAYYEEGGGVQYKCKEGFYFQHGSKAVCSAGKWKYPQCIKYTTCEYPRGEHLLNNPPNFKRIYKLGENTWYRCEYGYQRTAASITCTENSWEPEPQCIEITCQKPEIAHGEVLGIQKNTYNKNVKIALKCNQGYEPGIFFVTCNQNGEWDNMRQCTLGINLRCRYPEREINDAIRNDTNLKAYYEEGGGVQYKCKEGFYFQHGSKAVCSAGKWKYPQCIKYTTCEYPRGEHLLNNPPNFKRIYKLGENTWYRCEYGYQRTAESITCTENSWEPEPQCIEITCQKPEIAHGEVLGIQKNTYNKNVKIALKCNQGYEPGIFFVTCNQNGEWENMRQCTYTTCEYPRGEHLLNNPPNFKRIYKLGENTWYRCEYGYQRTAESITCTENSWEPEPQCIEITCQKPEIAHGEVLGIQKNTYNKNVKIALKCNQGYEPGIFFVTCNQNGEWENMRQCTLITCLLGSPTTGVVSTKPIGKNIFLAGEYVEIICSKKYWIFGTKQVSRNIKCKEDGKWELRPVCEEITCEYPRGEHLLNNPPYNKHIYKLGENTRYRCEYGYKHRAASITCTENGWEPEPQCIEITCQKPEIAHGEVLRIQKYTYNKNVKIALKCNQGYEPGIFFVTCNQNGEWENMRQCTLVKCPIISNLGDVITTDNTEEARYGDFIHFKCASPNKMLEGPEEIHCKDDGQWSDKIPKCKEKTTCAKTSVQNGFTYKLPGGFSYSCHANNKAFDEKWWGVVICTEGPQSYAPLCIPNDQCGQIPNVHAKKIQEKKGYKNEETVEFECESKPCCFKCISGTWQDCQCIPPSVENAVITSHSQHQVEYICRNNYTITGKRLISCNSSQWKELPSCNLGINLRCRDPEREINDAIRNDPNLKAYYEEGGGVQYKCKEGFHFQNGSKAVCSAGKWNYPQCIKLGINLRCRDPEREINDAIRNDPNLKAYYEEGGGVQYKCKEGFHFQNGSKAVCSAGKWNYPQCIKLGINLRCRDPEREINDAIRNDPNLKAYYEEGGGVQYKCKEGFHFQNGSKAVCSAGKWNYPQCIKFSINLRCRDPEREINDAIRNDPNLKAYYEEGGGVQYKCKEGLYFQNGSKAVCSAGKWNYPQCIKLGINLRCRDPEREINDAIRNDPNLKAYYEEGGGVQYRCKEGFHFQNGSKAVCSAGKWNYPQCIK